MGTAFQTGKMENAQEIGGGDDCSYSNVRALNATGHTLTMVKMQNFT